MYLAWQNRLYNFQEERKIIRDFIKIIKSLFFSLIILMGLDFLLRDISFSRLIAVYFYLSALFFLGVSRVVTLWYAVPFFLRIMPKKRIAIVGTSALAFEVFDRLKNQISSGYEICGFIGKGKTPNNKTIGKISEIKKIIQLCSLDELIIVISRKEEINVLDILKIGDREGVRIKLVPDTAGMISGKSIIEDVGGIPIISLTELPLDQPLNAALKRIADIGIALLLIILFSPFFIVVPVLLKIFSPGPVFFPQNRIGLDNKPFELLKFRTMHPQPQKISDQRWTVQNDERIFPLGRFLRKFSIDEIPQFFNVLTGSMSMVGPRPERPFFVGKFKNEIPYYMQRHRVKSGLTGWAQVNGYRGDTSINKRVELDLFYIENWSLILDLKIIFMTIPVFFFPKNAY
ncbi:MAG: undecaprenyl-phosphate glucose phosphotransferase [Spirochaetes bacterium GWF1_41_5]|nr:MAG: undecaprenyl-phosphate glucose phosphotransferase [Spirochaetes bacterium GWF1_41_5]